MSIYVNRHGHDARRQALFISISTHVWHVNIVFFPEIFLIIKIDCWTVFQ